ncbi:MAG: hypothetical protein GY841_16360 [FCB group bacterium]|nr:hypothetical protein [FCB group bacterium]
MKKYARVYRDKKDRPLVCVVCLTDGKSWARGVSVCSPQDTPNTLEGLVNAERYALRAMKGRERCRAITDRRAMAALVRTDCPWTYHLEIEPVLSFLERRRLFGKKMECPKKQHLFGVTIMGEATAKIFQNGISVFSGEHESVVSRYLK